MNMWSQLPYLKARSVRFVISLVKDLKDPNIHRQTLIAIKKMFSEEIRQGWLVVGLGEDEFFHSPKHKNRAHKLAMLTGWHNADHPPMPDLAGVFEPFKEGRKRPPHWLVNVDCDNVLPANFAPSLLQKTDKILDTRTGGKVVGFRCSIGNTDQGVTGRVGFLAESFLMLGGYNEAFYPTGYQDMDLFCRIGAAGTNLYFKGDPRWSIPNTLATKQKTKYKVDQCDCVLPWHEQNSQNKEMSGVALANGVWWANQPEGTEPPFTQHTVMEMFRNIGLLKGESPNCRLPTLLQAEEQPMVLSVKSKGALKITHFDMFVMSIGMLELLGQLQKNLAREDVQSETWMRSVLQAMRSHHVDVYGDSPEKPPKGRKSEQQLKAASLNVDKKHHLHEMMVKLDLIPKKDQVSRNQNYVNFVL